MKNREMRFCINQFLMGNLFTMMTIFGDLFRRVPLKGDILRNCGLVKTLNSYSSTAKYFYKITSF